MSFRSRRPSPAMIVALIALFVALGGTGYAALKLPKNSVSAKQLKKNAVTRAKIKKNAVTGAKVKKRSLTGSDINLAKLGTVPSAQNAATANFANSIPPAEPTHLVGAPGEPPFEAGSANAGSIAGIVTKPVGFYKDHDGIVHLQGVVNVGTGAGPVGRIFSLPPGYRPASGQVAIFLTYCGATEGGCYLDSDVDELPVAPLIVTGANVPSSSGLISGAVVSSPGTEVTLDGITYRAEG